MKDEVGWGMKRMKLERVIGGINEVRTSWYMYDKGHQRFSMTRV